jgi:uncharacterized protein (TIGR02996 family)
MRKFLRPISFFVCSVFRDMKAERAYLHDVILPEVSPQFEERGFRLEFKDPRQQSRSENDADGPVGLSQSLAFIDRCRPCFLGFFGAYYGHVLPRVPDQIGQHYPEIQFYARSSRAHLETLYGVLQNPHKSEHSFFYFRKPDFMESMSASDRALLESPNPSASQRGVEEFKLRMLKEAIVNSGRPVRKYDCTWDSASQSVTGLEALGTRIVADLVSVVDNLIPRPASRSVAVAAPAAVAVAAPVAEAAAVPPAEASAEVEAFSEADGLLMKELAEETAGLPDSRPVAEETLHGGEDQAMSIETETKIPEKAEVGEDSVVVLPEDEELDLGAGAPDADQGMTSMVGRSGLAHLSGMDGGTPPDAGAKEMFEVEEAGEPAMPDSAGADNPFAFPTEAPANPFAFGEETAADVERMSAPEAAQAAPFGVELVGPTSAIGVDPKTVEIVTPPLEGEPGVLEKVLQGPDGEQLRAERRDLLAKLADNPEDRDSLLAYADWLDRLGDPLGEFIRRDLELASKPPEEVRKTIFDRWGELLDRHGREWVRPLEALGLSPNLYGEFNPTLWLNHGVIESVTINRPGVLPERAAELFEAAPALRKITFEECSVNAPGLAQVAELRQIVYLGLRALSLGADDIKALADSPHLERVTELELNDNPFGAAGAAALADAAHFHSLESLDLNNCAIGPDGTAALAQGILLQNVRRLNLGSNTVGADGVRALVASSHLANLKALFLGWNGLGDDGAQELAAAPALAQLEALDLAGNELTPAAATALAQSAVLARLTYLDLTANEAIGSAGATELANWAHANQLKGLKLSRCHIGDEGVLAISLSERLVGLTKLDVGSNGLTATSAHALAASAYLADLTELDLRDNNLGPDGVQALLQSPHLSKIESLWLTGTGFTPEQEEGLKLRFGNAVNLY